MDIDNDDTSDDVSYSYAFMSPVHNQGKANTLTHHQQQDGNLDLDGAGRLSVLSMGSLGDFDGNDFELHFSEHNEVGAHSAKLNPATDDTNTHEHTASSGAIDSKLAFIDDNHSFQQNADSSTVNQADCSHASADLDDTIEYFNDSDLDSTLTSVNGLQGMSTIDNSGPSIGVTRSRHDLSNGGDDKERNLSNNCHDYDNNGSDSGTGNSSGNGHSNSNSNSYNNTNGNSIHGDNDHGNANGAPPVAAHNTDITGATDTTDITDISYISDVPDAHLLELFRSLDPIHGYIDLHELLQVCVGVWKNGWMHRYIDV